MVINFKCIILTSLILLLSYQISKACDPNCDHVYHIIVGGSAMIGTIVLAPLVGAAVDGNPKSPYLKALGLTTLSSAAAFGLGLIITQPSGSHDIGSTQVLLAALPAIAGITTSVIVYNKAKSRIDPDYGVVRQRWNFGIIPVDRGAAFELNITF